LAGTACCRWHQADGAVWRYNPSARMADSADYREVLEVLRNAARGAEERFLVGLPDPAERRRIATALAGEGQVVETPSTAEALARLTDESFDLAFLTLNSPLSGPAGAPAHADALATWRELRPF